MPGQTTVARPKRRFPVLVLILLMGFLGFAALFGREALIAWHYEYDNNRIVPVVKRAILTHATKGARFPVTLWNGPRILRIDFSTVQPGALLPNSGPGPGDPQTCVSYSLFDPKTGAEDKSSRDAHVSCIDGIAYRIAP